MPEHVTETQARERGELWINADVPAYLRRQVRVREFPAGFVLWAENRPDGPEMDPVRTRMVIGRRTGEATLWPALAVNDVIHRWEEVYGDREVPRPPEQPTSAKSAAEATSFLIKPPEWGGDEPAPAPEPGPVSEAVPPPPEPGPLSGAELPETELPEAEPSAPPAPPGPPPSPAPSPAVDAPQPAVSAEELPRTGAPGESSAGDFLTSGSGAVGDRGSVGDADVVSEGAPPPPLASEFPPAGGPLSGLPPSSAEPEAHSTPPPACQSAAEAPTELVRSESVGAPAPAPAPEEEEGPQQLPTMFAQPMVDDEEPPHGPEADAARTPSLDEEAPQPPAAPSPPPPPGGGVEQLPTAVAPRGATARERSGGPPPPPPPPPVGARGGQGPTGGADAPGGGAPSRAGADSDPHYLPTELATPSPGVAAAAAQASGPQPPAGQQPTGATPAGQPSDGANAAPQSSALPTVGPGYMAVLRYRGSDGSEQQIIERSELGKPHPEWRLLHTLRQSHIPPEQVLELHTELESCDLPGGYCARMVSETWPSVRVSHTAPYGKDHASRQQGVRHLLEHHGELHTHASAPARPQTVRVPLPQTGTVPKEPLPPPDALTQELVQTFSTARMFRFEERAVARQGVPDVVAHVLTAVGLPTDFGPFFWAQAQPGRPVPTLAELATERGLPPGPDAGTYLVVGSDWGRQLCVQYGTAHIMAVDMSPGPEQSNPRFVNTGIIELARSLALLGRMWPLRLGLTPEQAGHWTSDFQAALGSIDPAALRSPDTWWAVLVEQMWDGLL